MSYAGVATDTASMYDRWQCARYVTGIGSARHLKLVWVLEAARHESLRQLQRLRGRRPLHKAPQRLQQRRLQPPPPGHTSEGDICSDFGARLLQCLVGIPRLFEELQMLCLNVEFAGADLVS